MTPELKHDLSASRPAKQHWKSLLVIFAVWAVLRTVFFQGLEGYDDISYVRFASHREFPVDVFEVRFLFNPADYPGPDYQEPSCNDGIAGVEALINTMHPDRPRAIAFRQLLESMPSRTAVSKPAPCTIARLFPESMQNDDVWIRKPPAMVGRRSGIISSQTTDISQEVAQQ